MSRFIKQGVVRDGRGNVIGGARVSVFLAGTETPAQIYEEFDSVSHVNHVMSDEWGGFKFYVDDVDYDRTQLFTIVLSRQNADDVAWERIPIMQEEIASDVVINRSGSAAGNIAVFSGETGREIVDSGVAPYFHPNHTGDVTSDSDGATTITDKSVTLPKIADIDPSRMLGRVSVGSGTIESLTAAQVRSLLNIADGANNYTLPTASPSTLGGVKIGSRLSIVDGTLSADIQDVGGGAVSMGLGDLTDVDLTGLANDNILKYDSTNTKWIPSALPGSGLTVASGAEVDAGTDNTKGVTPKAIHDSSIRVWRKLDGWVRSGSGLLFASEPPITPGESIRITYNNGDIVYTSVAQVGVSVSYLASVHLHGAITESIDFIEYGGGEITQLAIPVNGLYEAKSETYLLQNYLKSPLLWLKRESYITSFYIWNAKISGTGVYPTVEAIVNGEGATLFSGGALDVNNQWKAVPISETDHYKVNYLDQIDISVTKGSQGNAEDLCVLIALLTP